MTAACRATRSDATRHGRYRGRVSEGYWRLFAVPTPRPHVRPWTAECALCLAVLEQALADVKLGSRVDSRHAPEAARAIVVQARAWIESSSTAPFSFLYLCETLGIEPHGLRRKVLGH